MFTWFPRHWSLKSSLHSKIRRILDCWVPTNLLGQFNVSLGLVSQPMPSNNFASGRKDKDVLAQNRNMVTSLVFGAYFIVSINFLEQILLDWLLLQFVDR